MSSDSLNAAPVQVNFALDIGWGQLRISAQVPAERVDLVQLLPAVKDVTNSITGAVAGVVAQSGQQISCRNGCAACCRQMIPVSLFELEEFANWVRSLPPEQQAVLERRFQGALAGLKSSGILDRLDLRGLPMRAGAKETELALEYLRAGVPCPFLQNESCGIYSIRPLICREYLVTSPPEFCKSPTLETVRPLPRPVKLSQALFALGQEITAERRGWMPLVFLFAWMRSGMSVAGAYQGTGPELLKLVVESIARTDDGWQPDRG